MRFALMLRYGAFKSYGKGSISMTSFTLALLPFDLSLFRKMKENVSELKLKVPVMTPLSFSSAFALASMTFDLSL